MIPQPFLWLWIIARFAKSEVVATEDDSKTSAAGGVLPRSFGLFQLTGHASPTLTEVNGGRLCVNGFGKTPPGYYFSGPISLKRCAEIAMEQPSPLGFRWGRPGFDYDVYTSYATPEGLGGNGSHPVDLAMLYPDPGDFMCSIYVAMDSSGQAFTFRKTNLSSMFKPKLRDGPASSMCLQRWTMTEFFKPVVSELWFCYMETSNADHCDRTREQFYTQGKIFMCVFVFFLGVLGWIMADMAEFEKPLVWFTRFLLNLELAMVAVAYLLTSGWRDTESPLFFLAAFVMDVVGAAILFVPYYVMEYLREDCFFNTAYLLLLAFSPCFLMEFMSYWSKFIVLVGHYPLLIGALAFITSASALQYKQYLDDYVKEGGNEKVEASKHQAELETVERGSYASVPTEEPAECSSKFSQALVKLNCGFKP